MAEVTVKIPEGTLHTIHLSETIDIDQSVALMVAKVTIDNDQWKVHSGNIY